MRVRIEAGEEYPVFSMQESSGPAYPGEFDANISRALKDRFESAEREWYAVQAEVKRLYDDWDGKP